MPLNISIDVDGTILDANENLLPHARESIQSLKDAGHCLQLWSAGGADYAYKHALKNKLTDLFESYAKNQTLRLTICRKLPIRSQWFMLTKITLLTKP